VPDLNLKSYHDSLRKALADDFLRRTLDKFAVRYLPDRALIFAGANENDKELIAEIAEAKDASLDRLEELYARFCQEASKKGVIVHRVGAAKEATDLVSRLARENNCQKIIKSKSMTTEEIGLNHALEDAGFEVTETDLGERIVQLRHERPSHMVLPAIHLSRFQVADTFAENSSQDPNNLISNLVRVARQKLRAKFIEADMGITGANFAVAESGTIGICTNEGNARLTTTLPRVHVAICGLDKLIPNIHDALRIIKVLPKNATAQAITTYVTWISGAVNCEANGPGQSKIFHVIFLDNGRTRLLKDPLCREALRCVRCGACANVCPVFRLVGGHQMGYVYIGAIGLILTYFFHGHEKAHILAQNCIGCAACKDVCAAKIDLPGLIQEIRARLNEEFGSDMSGALLGKVLANRKLFHALLKFGKFAQKPVKTDRFIRHLPDIFSLGQGFRALPAIADKSFRDRWPDLKPEFSPERKTVGLFAGCAQDFIYPQHLTAALDIFAKVKVNVVFPLEQTCCGLPVQTMGQRQAAIATAKTNIAAFKDLSVDYIVTLCASCAARLKNQYFSLLANELPLAEIKAFSDKVINFCSFLTDVVKIESSLFKNDQEKVGYHCPCHLGRDDEVEAPLSLLTAAAEYQASAEEAVCCGFGGTYSLKFPEISEGLLANKLKNLKAAGVTSVATDCPGCVMQLDGGAKKNGAQLKVEHLAEFLARRLA
jgi:iron-sulfur cluster protein